MLISMGCASIKYRPAPASRGYSPSDIDLTIRYSTTTRVLSAVLTNRSSKPITDNFPKVFEGTIYALQVGAPPLSMTPTQYMDLLCQETPPQDPEITLEPGESKTYQIPIDQMSWTWVIGYEYPLEEDILVYCVLYVRHLRFESTVIKITDKSTKEVLTR